MFLLAARWGLEFWAAGGLWVAAFAAEDDEGDHAGVIIVVVAGAAEGAAEVLLHLTMESMVMLKLRMTVSLCPMRPHQVVVMHPHTWIGVASMWSLILPVKCEAL